MPALHINFPQSDRDTDELSPSLRKKVERVIDEKLGDVRRWAKNEVGSMAEHRALKATAALSTHVKPRINVLEERVDRLFEERKEGETAAISNVKAFRKEPGASEKQYNKVAQADGSSVYNLKEASLILSTFEESGSSGAPLNMPHDLANQFQHFLNARDVFRTEIQDAKNTKVELLETNIKSMVTRLRNNNKTIGSLVIGLERVNRKIRLDKEDVTGRLNHLEEERKRPDTPAPDRVRAVDPKTASPDDQDHKLAQADGNPDINLVASPSSPSTSEAGTSDAVDALDDLPIQFQDFLNLMDATPAGIQIAKDTQLKLLETKYKRLELRFKRTFKTIGIMGATLEKLDKKVQDAGRQQHLGKLIAAERAESEESDAPTPPK